MPDSPNALKLFTLLHNEQERQGIPVSDRAAFAVYLEIPLEKLNAILDGQRVELEPNEIVDLARHVQTPEGEYEQYNYFGDLLTGEP